MAEFTSVQQVTCPSTASAFAGTFASTQKGSLLVARVAASATGGNTTPPAGWLLGKRIPTPAGASAGVTEIWYYPKNPGGITAVSFSGTASVNYRGQLSEYSTGQGTTQYLEAPGQNSAATAVGSYPVSAAVGNVGGALTCLQVNAWYASSVPATQTWTRPSPAGNWTLQGSLPSGASIAWAAFDSLNTAAGYQNGVTPSFSYTTGENAWAIAMCIFRVARFQPAGTAGGEVTTGIALDPTSQAAVLVGDVEGIFRSVDPVIGDHWQVAQNGLVPKDSRQMACVAWSQLEAGAVYACAGRAGTNGYFLASTDGGDTWTIRNSSTLNFSGGNATNPPLPSNDSVRSVGNLIAQDATNSLLYAATYSQGVYRSGDFGVTWLDISPGTLDDGNHYLRTLVINPANLAELWAGAYDYDGTGTFGHVWHCIGAQGTSPTWTQDTTSPAIVEEMKIIGGYIYAACGTAGVYRQQVGGTGWTNVTGGPMTAGNPYWNSLDGYVDGSSNHQIFACCNSGSAKNTGATNFTNVVQITIPSTWPTTGSITYTDLTAGVSAISSFTTMPPDGRAWWLAAAGSPGASYHKNQALGGSGFGNGHIFVDPNNTQNIYVTGHEGFFRSVNGGTTWTMAVNGLNTSTFNDWAIDPNDPLHYEFIGSDFTINSWDGDPTQTNPAVMSLSQPVNNKESHAIAFDPTDSTVYLGTNSKYGAATGGEVWTHPDGVYTWTATGWGSTVPSAATPMGIYAGRDASNAKYACAVAQGGGMWRYSGGVWSPPKAGSVAATIGTAGNTAQICPFVAGSTPGHLYCFDRAQGVYRSNDFGASWQQVWAVSANDHRSGWLAYNPAVTSGAELWVSTENGLWKLSNAGSGSVSGGQVTATKMSPFSAAGAGGVAVGSNGIIYAVTLNQQSGGVNTPTQILFSANDGASWSVLDTGTSVASYVSFPRKLSIDSNGLLILGTDTNNFVYWTAVNTPVITTTSPLPSGELTVAYSTTLAAVGGTPPYTWAVTAGALPPGLSLASGTGIISGTPTTAGAYNFTITVTDANSLTGSAPFTILVTQFIALTILTTSPLPSGVNGDAYTDVLNAVGGVPPYTWTITAGSLPTGLSLSSSGVISGTPTATGLSTATYKVTDAASSTSSLSLSITILTALSITTASLPNGTIEVPYSVTLASTGGIGPNTWSVQAGDLPDGLLLSPATGVLSGTPAEAGTFVLTIQVADSNGDIATQTYTVLVAVSTPSVFDSLQVGRVIELLKNRAPSVQPQCLNAQFMLAPNFDLNAPQPTTDVVAAMLLNGERPYGTHFSNRVITLPIVIQAPTRAILAAARELLLQTINEDTFELVWTRQGGLPLVFDCFRANPPQIVYSTKNEKLGTPTAQLTVSFEALPFGRSDVIRTLSFPATILNGPTALSSVLLDDFGTISGTSQPGWWLQSQQAAVDQFSAWWDWSITDHDSGPVYTAPVQGGPVDIAGLHAIAFWLGLGTDNYSKWHKGDVTFQVTLTDNGSNTITFGTSIKCHASNASLSPWWQRISIPIPQGVSGFNYLAVASYSISAWRLIDHDGSRELDSDFYINGLLAVPSVTSTQASSPRGVVYDVNAVVGTGPAPLSLQIQQPPSTAQTVQTYTTPGPVQFTPPADVTTVAVQKWGGGGAGWTETSSGAGGGGHGGEYAANPVFPCTPGSPLTGYVAAGGGGSGSGGFIGVVTSGSCHPSATSMQGTVGRVVTKNTTILVAVSFGLTNGHVTSVTDTNGNSYAQDFAAPGATTGQRHLEVWRCTVSSALGPSDTITVKMNNNQTNGGAFIAHNYSLLGTPDATPGYAFSSSGVTTLSPNATMLADDGVAFAACTAFQMDEGMSVGGTFSNRGPAVDGGNNSGGLELRTADLINGGAGLTTAVFNWNDKHTCVGVMLGYPVASSGSLNGQDTWFGADDSTAAHGGLGATSSTGASSQTGTSTDAVVFAGGSGATGSTTGGGGGESGGPGAAGHAGGNPAGGTGTPNAGDGGAGGAAGGNNSGQPGQAPGGGGGGGFSTGGAAIGGAGSAGQLTLTWTNYLMPFKTALIHKPGLDSSPSLNPVVVIGGGADKPDGTTEYFVQSTVASQNARFSGTYTVIAVNNTWDSPGTSRDIFATVNQYEYPGGPVSSASTPTLSLVPNNYDILNRNNPSGNGFVVLGEVTLPVRDLADDQTSAYFTVTLTSSDTADRFLDLIFIDTQGQTICVDINNGNGYCNYYVDAPDPNNDIGFLLGSTFDRSQAVSVIDSCVWAGGPMSVVPGDNPLLIYAVEGQPNLIATYSPCWFVDRIV